MKLSSSVCSPVNREENKSRQFQDNERELVRKIRVFKVEFHCRQLNYKQQNERQHTDWKLVGQKPDKSD